MCERRAKVKSLLKVHCVWQGVQIKVEVEGSLIVIVQLYIN
jgi:hypothetical protein